MITMKKLFTLFSSVAIAGLLATAAYAADAQAAEAKVVKVTGSAMVTLPGQTEAVALVEGQSLPAGSVITTGEGATVDIQPMAGTLTTIRANSAVSLDELSVTKDSAGVVTKQTAQLGLKSGNVVSALDPARKSINNYGIRTPKGVAAARGTVYSVTVNVTGGTKVCTMAGTVTLTPVGGGAPIMVDIGTGAVLNADGTSTGGTLAQLIAAEGAGGEIASAVAAAVTSVATAVQTGAITSVTAGASDAQTAVTMLAAVVRVASQANPTSAATFAAQAVTAVTAQGSSVSPAAAEAAAQGMAEAAAQGAALTNPDKDVLNAIYVSAKDAAIASANTGGTAVSEIKVNLGASVGELNATDNNAFETLSTPITPIDPTVVSPSGGQQ